MREWLWTKWIRWKFWRAFRAGRARPVQTGSLSWTSFSEAKLPDVGESVDIIDAKSSEFGAIEQ